ncbi:MAG: signal recognition particle-docking protein FtsY [Nanoarchaeota archaeon]
MFNFLKDKLKAAISGITEKAQEEIEKPITIEPAISITEKITEEKVEKAESAEIKKSIFQKIQEKVTLKTITKEKFESLFSEIELALLENNVAHEVVERIKKQLEQDLVDIPLKRNEISSIIKKSFHKALEDILGAEKPDILKLIKEKEKKPFIILVLGYNGVGKSISIAKIANYLKNQKLKVILAAGDTFRAAGSSQLAEYAKQIDVPVIKGKLGSDSCSIIYDAVNSAKSKDYDVVLADTAGRLHSNENLLNELKKIVRVNNPDLSILVLDSMTGSDVVKQAEEFGKAVKVDSVVLTKTDAYSKGGALLSAAYILKKPILFLGTGQNMSDLKEFKKEEIIKDLGF